MSANSIYSIGYNLTRWGRNLFRYAIGLPCKKTHRQGHLIRLDGFRNAFCGYYDRSPFRPGMPQHILVHANNENCLLRPKAGSGCALFLYDWSKRKVLRALGETMAWNWQQGARLMWLNESGVVYNIFADGNYRSRWIDVDTGETGEFQIPLQDTSGRWLIGLDYRILARYRPDYGYFAHVDLGESLFPSLQCLDLESGEVAYEVTWSQIVEKADIDRDKDLVAARVNHVCINPSSSGFIFLFRIQAPRQHLNTKHFLFYQNLETGRLDLLLKDAVVSHYCWSGNEDLVFWGTVKGVSGYYRLNIINGNLIAILRNVTDGHPSLVSDSRFLTDTYSDWRQHRRLYTFDNLGVQQPIAEWLEFPALHVEARCDLHPSVSRDGSYYQVDIRLLYKRFLFIGAL